MSSELIYESPMDILQVFKSKEYIADFLKWFFEQSEAISRKQIEENSNKFSPVFFSDISYKYCTDYQYFIYMLGRYISLKSNDYGKTESVCKFYGVMKRPNPDKMKITRGKYMSLLMYTLIETLGIFLDNGSNNVSSYGVFIQSLYEYKGKIFNVKYLSFNPNQMDYYIKNFTDDLSLKGNIFKNMDVKQVAFGYKNKKEYETNNQTKSITYFHFSHTMFDNNTDILEHNFFKNS